jgi:hypothetical protein
VPSDQNPLAGAPRAIELDDDKAKLLLDDSALERIINAVGGALPDDLNRDMLRRELLICYGRYSVASGPKPQSARLVSMQKHARRLIDLLKADDADLALIRATWPIDAERPAHLLPQLVFFVEAIDGLKKALPITKARARLDTSPLQQLVGLWLRDVYARYFGRRAGRSRRSDGALDGPYIRFARQVLTEVECSDETVARYMGFLPKK